MLDFLLGDTKFEDKDYVFTWPYIEYRDFFIFYKPDDYGEGFGFKFMSLQIIARNPDKPFLDPENSVEILYWGYAMFDGIRHLYLGHEKTENYGYINYPHIKNHVKLLEIIRELEIKYCRDFE